MLHAENGAPQEHSHDGIVGRLVMPPAGMPKPALAVDLAVQRECVLDHGSDVRLFGNVCLQKVRGRSETLYQCFAQLPPTPDNDDLRAFLDEHLAVRAPMPLVPPVMIAIFLSSKAIVCPPDLPARPLRVQGPCH
jgi:hypothetical protein